MSKGLRPIPVHPSAPGTAYVRLPVIVDGLTLQPRQNDPPTVVYGAFSLPLQDPFVLPGVDTICWMAGPCLSPG